MRFPCQKSDLKIKHRSKQSHNVQLAAEDVELQAVRFNEVAIEESSKWRGGLDTIPDHDLADGMVRLMSSEKDRYSLTICEESGRMRVKTSKGLKEGDVAMVCSVKMFTTENAVTNFINMHGYAALMEGYFLKAGPLAGVDGDDHYVYSVLAGMARLLGFPAAKQRRTNVKLVARAEKGANDGFIDVIVSTRNGLGIAPGSILIFDLGNASECGEIPTSTPTKKFRGALDLLIENKTQDVLDASSPSATAGAVVVDELASNSDPKRVYSQQDMKDFSVTLDEALSPNLPTAAVPK
jgi:hypothetical protein